MDITLDNRKDLFLERTIFREYISKDLINKILKSGKIKYSDYNSSPEDLWYSKLNYKNEKINNPEHHLKIYLDNYDDLKVRYKKFHHPWGRIYPELSVNILKAYIRRTLLKDDYYDFDIIGTYPKILRNICDKNGISCPVLKRVIKERDDILEYIIRECNFTNDRNGKTYAKDLIFINFYNGDEDDIRNKLNFYGINDNFVLPPVFKELKEEMDRIKVELIKRNPLLYEYCKKTFKNVYNKIFMGNKNTLGRDTLNGYFISLYLQEQELRIVDKITSWLYNNTNVMKKNGLNGYFIYEYDGFMLLKENVDREFGGPENFVRILNGKMDEYGIGLEWENKRLDENIMELEDIEMDYGNLVILSISLILIYLIYIYKNG